MARLLRGGWLGATLWNSGSGGAIYQREAGCAMLSQAITHGAAGMFISVFDIFKRGIGPSSSHTIGPMVAAARFLDTLRSPMGRAPGAGEPAQLVCRLHGSLAHTGKGHATDRAVMLGLAGLRADSLDAEMAQAAEDAVRASRNVHPEGLPPMRLDPDTDIVFDRGAPLPGHANGMILTARDAEGRIVWTETYYSVGGGFVRTAAELERGEDAAEGPQVPYPFRTAEEMLTMGAQAGLSIAAMKRANELCMRDAASLDAGLDALWAAMAACIERGLQNEGILPGGLKVRRRAAALNRQLDAERGLNRTMPHHVNDVLACYAMAVNEENAAGGPVVTAPTNGAAGVFPAVMRYVSETSLAAGPAMRREMLLTASAIGGIVKTNASISGADCGCQAEVGTASAMAAAALAGALGGTNAQIENAAEIALEHHLGMTCDPIAGLVQVPCIERNGLGAIKAVSAASLALRGDGQHLVSLDACIETMRQTGRDMSEKYKETALGGLAVNVPNC
jgi:L-serine dehydratase